MANDRQREAKKFEGGLVDGTEESRLEFDQRWVITATTRGSSRARGGEKPYLAAIRTMFKGDAESVRIA